MPEELILCPLKSSSKGNSTVICGLNTKILVDCGISGKTLECCLAEIGISPTELDAILVTHEHSDHIKGVGIVSRKYNIPIFASRGTWSGMAFAIGKIDEQNQKVVEAESSFYINDIEIKGFPIPHDANEPLGYTFKAGVSKVSIATDMGRITEKALKAIKGSNTVLLEANYDRNLLEIGGYPYELKLRIRSDRGHMCNEDSAEVARLLAESGTSRIILGHLSEENNFPSIAFETVKAAIQGYDVSLSVACCKNIMEFTFNETTV